MIDCKLIALDLDGTALKEGGWLSDTTRQAIAGAVSAGYIVAPTTGRTLSEIPDEVLAIPGIRYAIVSNGASVMNLESEEEIFADHLPMDVTKPLYDLMYAQNLAFQVYSEGVSYCDEKFITEVVQYFGGRGMNYSWLAERIRFVKNLPAYFEKVGKRVEKITINWISAENRPILVKALSEIPGIAVTSSDPRNMEINSSTANKGAALMQLSQVLGIAREQVMAIGDGQNDIEMLTFAGFSVAMGNAVQDARKAASYVTVTNNEDGVAVAFRKFLGIN